MLHTLCLGNKSSPPLVFLHGLLGSSQDFLPMMEELKDTFYCISLDLPGHGASPEIAPLSFMTTLEAIIDTLTPMTSLPLSIIGYSLGGRLAMLLDYHYPSLLKTMVIASAHPGLTHDEIPSYLLQQEHWISLLKKDVKEFLTLWYQQPLFHTLDQEHIIQQRSNINGEHTALMMAALSLTKQPSLWNHLATTKTPFLGLYGEHDLKYHRLYNALSPHLTKSAIPHASHAVHLENPIKCSNIIKKFLKSPKVIHLSAFLK